MPKQKKTEQDNGVSVIVPRQEETAKVIRYDVKGQPDNKLTDGDACAVQIIAGRNRVYRVRVNRLGQMYNPTDDKDGTKLNSLDNTTKLAAYTLRPTNEEAFLNYVAFLGRRLDTYLTKAERKFSL